MATNRVTGTNSGIDVEAVVKASLTTEQNKIDKAYQQQKIYEYQQEQLKEIVNQCTDFYDKYLDILSSDSLLKSSAYESVSFTGTDNNVTAKGFAGADATNYTVNVTSVASKASKVLNQEYFKSTINPDSSVADDNKGKGKLYIEIDGKKIEVDLTTKITKDDKGNDIYEVDLSATANAINEKLKEAGSNMSVKYSELSGGIVIESAKTGADQSFKIGVAAGNDAPSKYDEVKGTNSIIEISKNGGEKVTKESSSNVITVDGIEFTVNKKHEAGEVATKLTGKNDSSKLKETIVNFINDYNKLIQTINDKLLETRDTDYMPLTEDQKSEMTESEIKKWEEKAQTGLLRNDSDLKRIQSALKDSMRTFMSSSGLNLEKIGIKPVDNYGSKNGTFTIDEDKLSAAIESNPEGVKDLFTRAADSDATKNSSGGILVQLQSVLKKETKLSSSALSKRIGFSGTATENNNTLKKNIDKQKKLITELKSKYTNRETALFNKYSSLEIMLEKLNAQSNSLYSMLNIG